MQKIKYKLKEKLNNVKGAYSVMITVLILIMVTAMTGYVDIMNKKWAVSEVQTVMDTAGINTLQNQVNNTALRAEIFSLSQDPDDISDQDYADRASETFTAQEQQKYKSDMALYYKSELDRQIKGRTNVTEYDVERVDITFSYDDWGLGETTRKLPQITLDAVVRMRVKQTGMFDNITMIQRTMYSSRNNANFTVTYNGQAEDGQTELIVRSVTRLVYR